LGLAHHGARHAHHHVMEAAVAEVILDARAADPPDGAVDDVEACDDRRCSATLTLASA
jgi:hypothetical protein